MDFLKKIPRSAVDISALILLCWLINYPLLDQWWLADDPALLQSIVQHGVWAHFYQPSLWTVNVTPWVSVSLGLDWWLFGLEPAGFYAHHLLSLSLVLSIAYLTLNRFFSSTACLLSLCVFLLSAPVGMIAQLLMTRHYLEGLGFSLLSVWSYCQFLDARQKRYLVLSVLAYALAACSKEVYVPLPILMFLLPGPPLWERLKLFLPFVAAIGFYVVWRAYMLGADNLLSGYSGTAPPLNWNAIQQAPERISLLMGWNSFGGWQWLLLFFLIFPVLLFSRFQQLFIAGMWLGAVCLPVVPVLTILHQRYLFLPWFMYCVLLVISQEKLRERLSSTWYSAIPICLAIAFAGYGFVKTRLPAEHSERHRLEGEFVLHSTENRAVLLQPIAPDWHVSGLQWLRKNVLNLPAGPRFCFDPCLCQLEETQFFVQYRQGELDNSMATCTQEASELPLSVFLRHENNVLSWRFGPEQAGQYFVAIRYANAGDGQFTPVAIQGNYPVYSVDGVEIVVKFVSTNGQQIYSDALLLDESQRDEAGRLILEWQK